MPTCPECGDHISVRGQCGFCERFDSVMEEAREDNYQYTTEELIGDLRAVAEELETTPTRTQYTESGKYCSSTFIKRFGRWNLAVCAAGLEPNSQVSGLTPREAKYADWSMPGPESAVSGGAD